MELLSDPNPEQLTSLEKKIALATRIEEIRDLYGDIKELPQFGKKGGWYERLPEEDESDPAWLSLEKTRVSHRFINKVRQISDVEEQVVDYYSLDPDLQINMRRYSIQHANAVGEFLNFIGVRIPEKKQEHRIRFFPNADDGEGRLVITSFDNRNTYLNPVIKTVYKNGELALIALDPPKKNLKRGDWTYSSTTIPYVDFEIDSSFQYKNEPELVRPTLSRPWRGVRIDNLLVTSGRHADTITIGSNADFIEINGENDWTEEKLHAIVHKHTDPQEILEYMKSDKWMNFGFYPHPLYERK